MCFTIGRVGRAARQWIANPSLGNRWIGSTPILSAKDDRGVEKLAFRQSHKLKVVGSNPTPATNCLLYSNMTILYVNGCSFTAFKALEEHQRYPYILAQQQGWNLVDRSHPGSCNERIIRCTMRDCIGLLSQQQPIVALVQLTHLSRTEHAGFSTPETQWKYWQDQLLASIKPAEENLPKVVEDYLRLHVTLFNQQAAMIKLMVLVTGLTSFFQNNNIKYLIYNGPEDSNKFEPEEFYEFLSHDPNVLDLKTFNMLALTGSQRHPDSEGMATIADFLQKTIQQKILI